MFRWLLRKLGICVHLWGTWLDEKETYERKRRDYYGNGHPHAIIKAQTRKCTLCNKLQARQVVIASLHT